MDLELMQIQLTQDLYELAEEYEGAASNCRIAAKGSDTAEEIMMFEESAEHNFVMAQMYRRLAENAETLISIYAEG